MFTTFQTNAVGLKSTSGTENGDSLKGGRANGSRRITTPNACVECRRRKIRCDGIQPCGQCQWYQHPEACTYAKPVQRQVPSRKLVERLSSSIEQHQMILTRLFGSRDIESLVSLPREELLNLALSKPTSMSPSIGFSSNALDSSIPQSDGAESLNALEQAPDTNSKWDVVEEPDQLQGIYDDINALSLKVDKQTSYVGVSSINAALKVIFQCVPAAKSFVQTDDLEYTNRTGTSCSALLSLEDRLTLPPREEGERLIKSFFENVHPFLPMIDEDSLWADYCSGERTDSAWYALINAVFALGSLASGTTENNMHLTYYLRTRYNIAPRMDKFHVPNLEILQVIGMTAGYYLHWLNRPNEADMTMGFALRIALALGLHREYRASPQESSPLGSNGVPYPVEWAQETLNREQGSRILTADIRRRTWWSLFCLDTWASTTTGRPSLGRISEGVTVSEPGKIMNATHRPQDRKKLKLLPLIHNTAFCKIATKIQDKLSAVPLIPFDEVVQLDSALVRWWEDLPSMLTKDPEESIPSFLRVPRLVMKWRYQNLRIILHRPYLLSFALRKIPYEKLSAEEKVAIGKCRIIAAKTIEDITNECREEIISGWNGVWFVYQAVFVPLVSLFSDFSKSDETEKWRGLVRMAISFFSRMELYSVAAKKSGDVVSKLLNAAKSAAEAADAQRRQQEALMKVMAQREQQREQQQKQKQQRQHSKQQMTSHPHSINHLALQNMKTEDLVSPLSSPVDTFSQTFSSGPPNAFNSIQNNMPGVLSPAQSISSHMSQSSLTPTTDFSGLNLHMAPTHAPQAHVAALGSLPGLPNNMASDQIGVVAVHSGQAPQMGFWDDMMWDSYPEVENQSFVPAPTTTQWNNLENGAGMTGQTQNHAQWSSYSAS